jgi:hypothetical protein
VRTGSEGVARFGGGTGLIAACDIVIAAWRISEKNTWDWPKISRPQRRRTRQFHHAFQAGRPREE